jgi:hypothetical protein
MKSWLQLTKYRCAFCVIALALTCVASALSAQPIIIEGEASCFAKKVFKRDEIKLALDRGTNALFLKTHCGWQFFKVLSPQDADVARVMSSPIEVPPQVLAKAMEKLDKPKFARAH